MKSSLEGAGLVVGGFLLSLGFGQLVILRMADWLDRQLDVEPIGNPILDPWIVGTAERFFFTAGFALSPAAAFPTAGAWIAAKMAANWMARDPTDRVRGHRIKALVINLASMSFALVGGWIAGRAL